MSLNQTPSAERIHIALFGSTNSGKSSLINALTGQPVAIVSDIRGTTTDPVSKAMELLPLGPIVFVDTPGLDDRSELGLQRIDRAMKALNKTDLALLVIDITAGVRESDIMIFNTILERQIPLGIVFNKTDLLPGTGLDGSSHTLLDRLDPESKLEGRSSVFQVSALSGQGIFDLKERLPDLIKEHSAEPRLISDLVAPGATVVLVVPIDASAPKGRLILPQQQTIRELLDTGVSCVVTQDKDLEGTLQKLKNPPDLVVTDSQAFEYVSGIVPDDVPLTSFSILFARYRGILSLLASGADQIDKLKSGDRILISEGCTHHRQCEDIGTVKLPKWLKSYTKELLEFDFSSGGDFPADLSRYSLIIHCGACTLHPKEMQHRLKCARIAGIPITNYGIAIAKMKGILNRSLAPMKGE